MPGKSTLRCSFFRTNSFSWINPAAHEWVGTVRRQDMTPETRLAELKLELPPAPKPVAVYKPLVITGNLAYISGHGPLKPDKTLITGRVGGDLDLEQGKAAARQGGLAILAPLRRELGSLDR